MCYQNWAPGNGTTPENCRLEKRKGAVQSGGDQRWISRPELTNSTSSAADINRPLMLRDTMLVCSFNSINHVVKQ